MVYDIHTHTYIFMCSASVGYGNPPNSAPVFIARPLCCSPALPVIRLVLCSLVLSLSLSLPSVCHSLWPLAGTSTSSSTPQYPVPGYSSNMPVNYIIMQSQHAPWAAVASPLSRRHWRIVPIFKTRNFLKFHIDKSTLNKMGNGKVRKSTSIIILNNAKKRNLP